MGFGGTIIHGLYSWSSAAHGILKLVGESNPDSLKEFQARFASPVEPGDRLATEIWRMGETKHGSIEIRFCTKNQNGEVVLSNGRALMKVSIARPKI